MSQSFILPVDRSPVNSGVRPQGLSGNIMVGVRVEIVRYVNDSQPDWVEARLRDASGREWVFVEKVSILTEAPLSAGSVYPQPGVIACELVKSWRDERGREVHAIDTSRPWGVEAQGGVSRFEVFAEQLVLLEPAA